jgi:predicted enzyme related to lactoylglutathione lyase
MATPSRVRRFSVECDDVERAKSFYEGVFGWTVRPWGPPGYYQVFSGPEAAMPMGDLRGRREPLAGTGCSGYECTICVDDLSSVLKAVEAHGGRIADRPFRIEGVGELAYFEDTEGNRAGVMQYEGGLDWDQQ